MFRYPLSFSLVTFRAVVGIHDETPKAAPEQISMQQLKDQ
jgi:hypothetical protein